VIRLIFERFRMLTLVVDGTHFRPSKGKSLLWKSPAVLAPPPRVSGKIHRSAAFGAMSTMVMNGNLLSGRLVAMASYFMVFEISLEIETQKKGRNENQIQAAKQSKGRRDSGVLRAGLCREIAGIAVVVLGPKRALP
jgi:hypothetical protein